MQADCPNSLEPRRSDLRHLFVDGGKCIGRGTFSAVYVMRSAETGVPCAVKIMEAIIYDNEEEQWRREISGLSQIRHPNVVSYLGVVLSVGEDWMAIGMGLCDLSLHEYLRSRFGMIDSPLALSFACQLCSGVEAMHAAGYMHRDLKTRNILIKLTHAAPELKVADLGSCRCFNTGRRFRIRQKSKEAVASDCTPNLGTVAYRAPELAFGSTEYSKHVDTWSVGCIVSELFSGDKLFGTCRNDSDLAASIVMLLGEPGAMWPANAGPIDRVLGPTFSTLGTNGSPSVGRMPAPSSIPAEVVRKMLQWYPPCRLELGRARNMLVGAGQIAPLDAPLAPLAAPSSEGESIALLAAPSSGGEGFTHPPPPVPLELKVRLNRYCRHRHPPGVACRCDDIDSPCECSGNCMQAKHRSNGCKGVAKVGSRFCVICECRMLYCTAAKYSALGYCKAHARVALAIGPSLRLAASATQTLSQLFPCDGRAVLDMFPQLFQPFAPLALLIILAMLKEPTAMKKWIEIWNESLADAAASAQGIQGEELAAALERLASLNGFVFQYTV